MCCGNVMDWVVGIMLNFNIIIRSVWGIIPMVGYINWHISYSPGIDKHRTVLYNICNSTFPQPELTMLAVAINEIQVLYDNQPLLTQVGGFPAPGSADATDNVPNTNEADDGTAS
jgi:hypothetical protein